MSPTQRTLQRLREAGYPMTRSEILAAVRKEQAALNTLHRQLGGFALDAAVGMGCCGPAASS